MRRVAEVIYIVPEEREAYLQKCLNPSEETQKLLWMKGVRNQFYFELQGLIIMTFEYVGHTFQADMDTLASYPQLKDICIPTRRRDVPAGLLMSTNWWAPVKRLGGILTGNMSWDGEAPEHTLGEHRGGFMVDEPVRNDISYSDDDWSESVHF